MFVQFNTAGKMKPAALGRGDQVAIVSLSAGTLGENFASHQRTRGVQRLRDFGLVPRFMPNSLLGIEQLAAHPELRAADLKAAFMDPTIKGIICAIGGEDTFRLAPYLFEDPEFVAAVAAQPKLFTGFSDTTINHLMLYQLGLQSFYGPNFLNDLAELDYSMLPYTKATFAHYFEPTPTTVIASSPVWYEERTDFSPAALDTPRVSRQEGHGYECLRGTGKVTGSLLGGCLESLDDLLTDHLPGEKATAEQYQLLPPAEQWRGKILFIETSEERPDPASYQAMLEHLKQHGLLNEVAAIIAGKPQNERYYKEYKALLLKATADKQTPILFNLNFGHAYPRTSLPYGAQATVNFDAKTLTIDEPYFA